MLFPCLFFVSDTLYNSSRGWQKWRAPLIAVPPTIAEFKSNTEESMKITSTFHVVFCLVVLLTLSTPLIAFGVPDPTQPAEPHRQAKPAKQVDTPAEPTQHTLSPAEALTKCKYHCRCSKRCETYINKPMWFMLGCMLPVFGLITPYLYKPIPAGELINARVLLHRCLSRSEWRNCSFVLPSTVLSQVQSVVLDFLTVTDRVEKSQRL